MQLKVKNAHFLELCIPRGCGLRQGTHCSSWHRTCPTAGANLVTEWIQGPRDSCQEWRGSFTGLHSSEGAGVRAEDGLGRRERERRECLSKNAIPNVLPAQGCQPPTGFGYRGWGVQAFWRARGILASPYSPTPIRPPIFCPLQTLLKDTRGVWLGACANQLCLILPRTAFSASTICSVLALRGERLLPPAVQRCWNPLSKDQAWLARPDGCSRDRVLGSRDLWPHGCLTHGQNEVTSRPHSSMKDDMSGAIWSRAVAAIPEELPCKSCFLYLWTGQNHQHSNSAEKPECPVERTDQWPFT